MMHWQDGMALRNESGRVGGLPGQIKDCDNSREMGNAATDANDINNRFAGSYPDVFEPD